MARFYREYQERRERNPLSQVYDSLCQAIRQELKLRDAEGDLYDRVQRIEKAIKENIGAANLIPNLMLHEFEALLFSKPECFSYCRLRTRDLERLCRVRENAETLEHINNNPMTAPSKRILSIYPEYNKVVDGFHIAEDIGIETMRRECKHFDAWIQKIHDLRQGVLKVGPKLIALINSLRGYHFLAISTAAQAAIKNG